MAQKSSSIFSSSRTPYFIAGAAGFIGILHYLRTRQRRISSSSTSGTIVPSRPKNRTSSPKYRLCIASCSELVESIQSTPNTQDQGITETYGISGQDELHLYEALNRQGLVYDIKAWDDKTVDWTTDYDIVVVRTTWDYSKSETRAYEFRRWLAILSSSNIAVYNDPRILSWNLHKDYLRELANKSGIPSIPTIVVRAGTPKDKVPLLTQIMEEYGWNDIFIKPCIGGGSRACIRIRGNEEGMVERGQEFLYYHVTPSHSSTPSLSSSTSNEAVLPVVTAELTHLQSLHNLPTTTTTTNTSTPSTGTNTVSSPSSASDTLTHSSATYSTAASLNVGSPASAAVHARQLAEAATKTIQNFLHSTTENVVSSLSSLPPSFLVKDGETKVTNCVPCDMMIQPYISSVEELGELSVIIIDGEVSHTIVKLPVAGDFRVQEEFGGINGALQVSSSSGTKQSLTAQNDQEKDAGTLALRVMEAAKECVEAYEPPLSPHSLDIAQYSTVLPCSLKKDSLLTGRIDFLRLTTAAAERVFRTTTPSSSSMHLHPSLSSLILLEAELIEPCLFFHADPQGLAADKLALAIARRIGTLVD